METTKQKNMLFLCFGRPVR